MKPASHHTFSGRHNGSILVLVLMAIVIMSLATSSYLVLMRNEHIAARNSSRQLQARMIAESGMEYLGTFLAQSDSLINQQGGRISNPTTLQSVLVVDDAVAAFRGRFTVLAPDLLQGYYSGVRYGVEDESTKLNLNTLLREGADENEARQRLLMLPGMNEEIADAILDWIDEDDQVRSFGAESTYYLGLDPPYQPRNGPFLALDELLMVRGVTPELLYGIDTNRNFSTDTQEQPRGPLLQLDNSMGRLDRGWSAYLTIYSAESTIAPTGEAKLNVNSTDLQNLHSQLQQVLGQEATNFIIAYRQYGSSGSPGEEESGGAPVGSSSAWTPDFSVQASNQISSFLDLVGVQVTINQQQENQSSGSGSDSQQGPRGPGSQPGGEGRSSSGPQSPSSSSQSGESSQVLISPWQDDPSTYSSDLLLAFDQLATTEQPLAGRININQASRPVLRTLPQFTETTIDQILSQRETLIDPVNSPQRHAIWLLASGLVTLEEMKELEPLVCSGGGVFSAQVVGFFDDDTTRSRIRVVFDCTTGNPEIAEWTDLTQLGPGFTPLILGAQP